jgi:hypothetical protein
VQLAAFLHSQIRLMPLPFPHGPAHWPVVANPRSDPSALPPVAMANSTVLLERPQCAITWRTHSTVTTHAFSTIARRLVAKRPSSRWQYPFPLCTFPIGDRANKCNSIASGEGISERTGTSKFAMVTRSPACAAARADPSSSELDAIVNSRRIETVLFHRMPRSAI